MQSYAIAFVLIALSLQALGQTTEAPGGEPLSGRELQEQNVRTLKAAQAAYMEAAEYTFRNGATLRTVPTQDPVSAELFSNGARYLTVSSDGPIGDAVFSNPAVLQMVVATLPRPPEPPPVSAPPPAPSATASAPIMSVEPPPSASVSPAPTEVATQSAWSEPAPPTPEPVSTAPRSRVNTVPTATAPPVVTEEPQPARPVEATPSVTVRLRPVLAVFGGMARVLAGVAVVIFLATLTIYALSLGLRQDGRRGRRRLSRAPFRKLP